MRKIEPIPAHGRAALFGLVLSAAVLMAACGGDAGSEGAAGEAGDSPEAPAPAERTVSVEIPEEELGELQRENIDLALRWTTSRIGVERQADATPVTTIAAIDYAVVGGVDRMTLTFEGDGTLPSYTVESTINPVVRCAEGAEPVASEGEGLLRIRFSEVEVDSAVSAALPDAQDDSGASSEGPAGSAMGNVTAVSQACRSEGGPGATEWVLDVERATYYRVLHLSDPTRLVVDVRHNLDGSPAQPSL